MLMLAQEFESLLKDVVNAKRLSASKMTGLTDLAMKNMKVCLCSCVCDPFFSTMIAGLARYAVGVHPVSHAQIATVSCV